MRTTELALLLLLATVTCTAAEGAIKINIDEELANIADLEEEFHEYGRRGFTGGGLSGGGFSGSGKAGAQGPKYISLGCWKDTGNRAIPTLEGKDARLDGSYTARANAIEKCYQVAKSRGFSVFAVQNGGQCAGSATALNTYRKYGPSAGCRTDGEGGGWANQVYLITDSPITLPAGFVPKPYFSIGCWKDTRNNPAIPTLEGKDARLDGRYHARADAIDKCYQVAKSRGFKAFAVRNGGWCAGSATAHKTYNKYGPYTTCRQDGEGGPLGNEVYLISDVFTQNKAGGEVAKVQGPKYISLGCWKDTDNRAIATLEGTDPRLDGSYRARANAIEKCYQVAKSRGFSVFAVQHGGWCAGSATALSTYRKYGPSAACQADGEGGGWANQVYLITDSPITLPAGFVPKPYFSIGCWKDTENRAIPTLEGKDARLDGSYTARANAIEKCYQVAKSRGFKAFAVQNGGWCAGSATALSTYKKYGPYTTCKTDGEGGAWGNEVYLISDALTSSKEGEKGGGEVAKVQGPKYFSLGCWKDTGNRAIATLEGTDARLDGSYTARKNAIEKCYQVAKSRRFSVFAVQNGGWCAGSANAFSTYRKYGPYTTCKKDGEGGAWGNEVYLIIDEEKTAFRDKIVQGLNERGKDLEAISKYLIQQGSRLSYRRYAETLFDILIAGGMLAPGGLLIEDADKTKTSRADVSVFTTPGDVATMRTRAQIFERMIRQYKYLEKSLDEEMLKVLTFLKGFSDEERARLATFTFLVISTGLVTPKILTSLFHENLIEEETCGLSAFRHVPRTDCSGSDISSPPGVTLQGCAEACCADSTCLSFQYNIVNQCYLKSRLCSNGQKVSTSAGNMYDISGISLDFATALFKTWLSEKDFNSLISNLKKAGIEQRLPELFPANKRSPEHLESHFRAAGLGPIADYLKEQQNRANTKELKMELKKKLANGNDVKEIVIYVKDYMKKKKLAEHEVVVLVWSSVMKSVEWNKKEDLAAEQAIRLLKAYAPLLAALTTQGRSELDLLVAIQNYCYDNMQFMKVFHKILVLLYEADVFSKDTILKWHKDGHSPKGKSVFLEQTKEFVEQLQSAKEAREVEADADPENAFEAMGSSLLQEEAVLSDREADKFRRSESETDFHGLVRLSELKAALEAETEYGPAAMERLNQISRELGEVWQAEEDPDVDDDQADEIPRELGETWEDQEADDVSEDEEDGDAILEEIDGLVEELREIVGQKQMEMEEWVDEK